MEKYNESNKYFWIPVIELAVLAFTTLGTTITLFIHSDSKMEEFRKDIIIVNERLVKQDAEFKAFLMYGSPKTQERNN